MIENSFLYLNGNPVKKISILDKIEMCLKHLTYLQELKNEKLACLEIRNHIGWYFKGVSGCNELKNNIYKTTNICDIISITNKR